MKINWAVKAGPNKGDFEHHDEWELEDDENVKIEDLEREMFAKVAALDVEVEYLYVRASRPDGSGWIGWYKKSGDVWVRTLNENIMPNWFPWFFFGLIGLFILFLIILCSYGFMPWW